MAVIVVAVSKTDIDSLNPYSGLSWPGIVPWPVFPFFGWVLHSRWGQLEFIDNWAGDRPTTAKFLKGKWIL